MNAWDFFTDPLLRGPTMASMWMCFSAGLIGVLIFLRKRSLVGETLSHAAYPGVTLALLMASFFASEDTMGAFILISAFLSALLGYGILHLLQSKLKISVDASLCFVLTAFVGIGITIASRVQFTQTQAFRQLNTYLYGQAATMSDFHIYLYAGFSLCIVIFLIASFKELQALAFDKLFARSIGIRTSLLEVILLIFTVLTIVIGMRSVGVILMSGMLVAPAVAARQYTNRLFYLLVLSGVIGLISGFLGNYLSVVLPLFLSASDEWHASLPTGPMIVLVAATIAAFSLLFAPERGFLVRCLRIAHFRIKRRQENLLKALWRKSSNGEGVALKELAASDDVSRLFLWFLLLRFRIKKWIFVEEGRCLLTKAGSNIGARIVRLHRLWEAYLVTYLGEGAERVHHSAEEMEHILTPELEKQLTELLANPLQDPHAQPIPPQDEVMTHG